ncbi:hypothetical protein FACS1894190_07070 [Spirochaetia bacterium]|nr:hypothetical protein FACS1894190_07070 [Spirochaetia bacterium]
MINMKEYGTVVHRSLMQRDLMIGIPPMGLLLILLLGVFFMYILELYIMGIPIAVLYIVMRLLTKKDPYLIDIVLDNIMQKDKLIP